jgi:hypothetical protein
MELWNNNTEIKFFQEALKNFATPEQLFYKLQSGYYAYIPRDIDAEGQTLQSRNSLIGQFTEKWCKELLSPIANQIGLFAINGVICEDLGLTNRSSADLAFCTRDGLIQKPENIKIIFEIKMSIVSNYKFERPNSIIFVGDYKQHRGNPSLLRSDSMLKAIGKSINIRVSGYSSSRIPIIILGNSPITDSYQKKVDYLKTSGVIQGFFSLNPKPTTINYIESTVHQGFRTIKSYDEILPLCKKYMEADMNYFSAMLSKSRLGSIIQIASQEQDIIAKAEKFLNLIQNQDE